MGSTSDDGLRHHEEEENQDGFPKYFKGFGVPKNLSSLTLVSPMSREATRCEITKLIPIKRIHS